MFDNIQGIILKQELNNWPVTSCPQVRECTFLWKSGPFTFHFPQTKSRLFILAELSHQWFFCSLLPDSLTKLVLLQIVGSLAALPPPILVASDSTLPAQEQTRAD